MSAPPFTQVGRRQWSTPDGRHTIRNVAHERYVAHHVTERGVSRVGEYPTLEAAIDACAGKPAVDQRERARAAVKAYAPELGRFLDQARTTFAGSRLVELDVPAAGIRLRARDAETPETHENGDGV